MSVSFVINPLDFVQNAGIHHGKIPVDALVRLHDFLFDKEGELIYQISGQFDKNEKPVLHLEIKGKIHLSCQRCLGQLIHTVDLQTFLVLAKNEAELEQADEDDTADAILATPDMDIVSLIEDEIILSLSISSRHAEGECGMQELESINDSLPSKTQPAHPFAALLALKKTN